MNKLQCTCIRCDVKMPNIMEAAFQPSGGLAFMSYGHYGSAVFDMEGGSWLELCLCDHCLAAAIKRRDIIRHDPQKRSFDVSEYWGDRSAPPI